MATRPPDWFHATAFVLCVDESTPITNLSVALVIRNPRSVAAALADDRPATSTLSADPAQETSLLYVSPERR